MTSITASAKKSSADKKLDALIWVVLISTILSCFGVELFKKSISAFGWIVPLLFSLLSLLKSPTGIRFPLMLWLPWISVAIAYQLVAGAENSFQRTIIMLTPLIIGVAASRIRLEEQGLQFFLKLCRLTSVFLIIIVIYKTNLLFIEKLPFTTGLAPEVITGAILNVIFASSYVLGNSRDLAWWAAIAAIPVLGVTRMGMIGSAVSLPFTLAPMKKARRLVFICLLIVIGIMTFFTERVQQKMFYSGQGGIENLQWENPDLATNGRYFVWKRMKAGIAQSPWLGNGANSSEALVSSVAAGLTHPHNDWLRLAYDYGYVGASIFGLTLIWQIGDLLNKARRAEGTTRVLFYAGASSIIIFILFMLTDNIILYASFFGNLQFMVLGIAYGSHQQAIANPGTLSKVRKWRIKW